MESMEKYEELVAAQTLQLGKMNKSTSSMADEEELDDLTTAKVGAPPPPRRSSDLPSTTIDMQKEEDDVAELERRKRVLEERVNGMEKDLGGLMR